MALAVLGDGKTIVSGSRDSTIRLWDSSTGESLPAQHSELGLENLLFKFSFDVSLVPYTDEVIRLAADCDKVLVLYDHKRCHAFQKVFTGDPYLPLRSAAFLEPQQAPALELNHSITIESKEQCTTYISCIVTSIQCLGLF